MVNIGDKVWYNEGDSTVASWASAIVCQTPMSNPGAYVHFSGLGGYPTTPTAGHVLLAYLQLVGNSGPVWQSAYASEGTAPGQYLHDLPD